MLRERVGRDIRTTADRLSEQGLQVTAITEMRFGDEAGHGSRAYTLSLRQNGDQYRVRVDHRWDPKEEDSVSLWCCLGTFDNSQLPPSAFFRLGVKWAKTHIDLPFKLVRTERGDIILGTRQRISDINEVKLAEEITSLIDIIPEAERLLEKSSN